jgi:hypothetical protein
MAEWAELRRIGLVVGIDIDTQAGMDTVIGMTLERGIDLLDEDADNESVETTKGASWQASHPCE